MPPLCGTVAPLRRIRSIDFGILSPDEVVKNSVTTGFGGLDYWITRVEISANGKPVKGGLNDPRMGTISSSGKCETCNRSYEDCPGHFGHIHLNAEIFHTGFLDIMYLSSRTVMSSSRVLTCICFNCGKCLVPRGDIPENETDTDNCRKLSRVFNRVKTIKDCSREHGGCGHVKAKYKKER